MAAKVVQLHSPIATCPQCKCQEWYIHVNGFYDDYDKVTAHECVNCGFTVIINVEVIKENADSSVT